MITYRIFLVLSLLPMAIYPQNSESKSRLKIGTALGVTAAFAGLQFLRHKPVKLDRIARNIAQIHQNPLLGNRHHSAQAFLRAYEQEHMIPQAIKGLDEVEQKLIVSMEDLTKARHKAPIGSEHTKKCDAAFDNVYKDLVYVQKIKRSLQEFNEKFTK